MWKRTPQTRLFTFRDAAGSPHECVTDVNVWAQEHFVKLLLFIARFSSALNFLEAISQKQALWFSSVIFQWLLCCIFCTFQLIVIGWLFIQFFSWDSTNVPMTAPTRHTRTHTHTHTHTRILTVCNQTISLLMHRNVMWTHTNTHTRGRKQRKLKGDQRKSSRSAACSASAIKDVWCVRAQQSGWLMT